jgi:hypothetical protein
MRLKNKFLYTGTSFLLTEKFGSRHNVDDTHNNLMRLDLQIRFPQDVKLIFLCILSMPVKYDTLRVYRTDSAYTVECRVHEGSVLMLLPFIFSSLFQYDIDSRFYFYWIYRYSTMYNKSIRATYQSKDIGYTNLFDEYFAGLLDANYNFNICISAQYRCATNSVYSRITQSLFGTPFVTKSIYG